MAVRRRLGRAVAGLRGDGRGRLLGSVAAGWFLVLGTRFVVPALLPTISAEFRIDNATAGLAVTVLWATYALLQFPTGAMVDRIGERALLVGSLVLSAGALLAYGFSPVFSLFLLATAAFGFGTGAYGPARGILLSRTFDAREATAFGVVLGAGSLGAAALPALAAVVTVRWGWRVALAGIAPAFLAVAGALWWTVTSGERADSRGRSLAAELRRIPAALRSRQLVLAVTGAALMLFAFQAVTAFLTTYLVSVHRFSQATAGVVLSLVFVGGALAQVATGSLADRFETPRVLTAIALASVVPLVALPLVEGSLSIAVASVAVGLRSSAAPLSNAYIVDVLPDAVEGTAWGAIRTTIFVLGSTGSTVVGVLADNGLFAEAFYLLAAITAAAAVTFLMLPVRE